MMKKINLKKSQGFTIIELLIATTVFSAILLLATFGLIKISYSYYKSITQSNTQKVARAVIDSISQDIQFGGGVLNWPGKPGDSYPINGSPFSICVGSNRYSARLNYQLQDSPTSHVLVKSVDSGCAPGDTIANFVGGTLAISTPQPVEMLAPKMRLAILKVTYSDPTNPNLYNIHVRVVYGDDDLICSPAQGNCNNNTATNLGVYVPDMSCRTQAGNQFCALADLETNVDKRVN